MKKQLGIEVPSHLAEFDCLVCHEVYKHCLGMKKDEVAEKEVKHVVKKNSKVKTTVSQVFDQQIAHALELEKENRMDEAIDIYEACIKEKCSNTEAYDRLIILYRKRREKENEIRVLQLAVKLFPKLDKYVLRLNKII